MAVHQNSLLNKYEKKLVFRIFNLIHATQEIPAGYLSSYSPVNK